MIAFLGITIHFTLARLLAYIISETIPTFGTEPRKPDRGSPSGETSSCLPRVSRRCRGRMPFRRACSGHPQLSARAQRLPHWDHQERPSWTGRSTARGVQESYPTMKIRVALLQWALWSHPAGIQKHCPLATSMGPWPANSSDSLPEVTYPMWALAHQPTSFHSGETSRILKGVPSRTRLFARPFAPPPSTLSQPIAGKSTFTALLGHSTRGVSAPGDLSVKA
jgi:hypothetical protein